MYILLVKVRGADAFADNVEARNLTTSDKLGYINFPAAIET